MRPHPKRRNSEKPRTFWRLSSVLAILVTAVAVSVSMGAARPSTSGAVTDRWGAYGGGQLMAVDPDGGYWTTTWAGSVTPYGGAPSLGSPASFGIHPSRPVLGMAATPTGHGYWLVASDGGVFSFGDAAFYGSTGAIHLNQPIVGMAATPTGQGYWLVASDGGIFAFGDAAFYGSLGGTGKTVLGFVISPSTPGYDLVESDGTESAFTAPTQIGGGTQGAQTQIGGGTQGADCVPTVQPTATVDSSLDTLIANETGPGWIGGDGAYSTELPNGQESFVFSDTLIGTAQSSGQTSGFGMVNNSELVGAMPYLNTDIGGTYGSPQSLIPDTSGGANVWWVASTYVENGTQLIYVNQFDDGRFTGTSGIAVLSLSGGGMPSYSSITLLPTDPDTAWGTAVVQDASYTYVYGEDYDPSSGVLFGMKIARVLRGQTLNVSD